MNKIKAILISGKIYSNSKEAYYLNEKSRFGEKKEDKIYYNPLEAIYLINDDLMEIYLREKLIGESEILRIFQKEDKEILTKYLVFQDLRKKGYVIKAGLKFGAEFRIYDKKERFGEKHSKWILMIERESKKIDWNEFSSKNRVAHSTNKKLLIAIVDKENNIIYYEVSWIKP